MHGLLKRFELIDGFLVEHPQIDAEHKELVDRANELIDAIEAKDRKRFLSLLGIFFELVAAHFENEIRILRRLGFPRVEKHVKFHNEAIVELSGIRGRLEADVESLTPESVHHQIFSILVHDLIREDLDFKSFLIEARQALS